MLSLNEAIYLIRELKNYSSWIDYFLLYFPGFVVKLDFLSRSQCLMNMIWSLREEGSYWSDLCRKALLLVMHKTAQHKQSTVKIISWERLVAKEYCFPRKGKGY